MLSWGLTALNVVMIVFLVWYFLRRRKAAAKPKPPSWSEIIMGKVAKKD